MKYYVISKARTEKGEPVLRKVFTTTENREGARAYAKTHEATVATEEEFKALCDKGVIRGEDMPKAPPKSMLELAQGIAAAPKKRQTVGTKPKVGPKRVVTDPAVIEQAKTWLAGLNGYTKVQAVRSLAAWKSPTGVVLQRRDMYVVLQGSGIADATISTQFQLVRSGKWSPK